MSFVPLNPRPLLQSLINEDVIVRLKWGQTEYKGRLISVDSYMNIQLSNTEEFIDGKNTGTLGQVLIRRERGRDEGRGDGRLNIGKASVFMGMALMKRIEEHFTIAAGCETLTESETDNNEISRTMQPKSFTAAILAASTVILMTVCGGQGFAEVIIRLEFKQFGYHQKRTIKRRGVVHDNVTAVSLTLKMMFEQLRLRGVSRGFVEPERRPIRWLA
ncbi:hypothetical protein PRK78_002848 [Emydomyces testavorans]|uniref:Sm protein F n=1 Tax=Emydomyces testavorans TaxID=2070801 RepID=A0AAF0DH39_9EURO|nr:hypothetical protein PRK78_002848 [Emydomyces testavorans]